MIMNNNATDAEVQANVGTVKYADKEIDDKTSDSGLQSVSSADPYFRYKLAKQSCLVIIWICMGMAAEMSGPTLPDLKDRMGVDYEEISRALVGKSFGLMIGSILGGFLNERFYKQTDLIISINLALMAVGCYIIPWSVSVPMAACGFAINGFTEGVINTGGNTMVMDLWGIKAASPMHSLHFGFGFGALLAPQIARPFLGPDMDDNSTDSYLSQSWVQNTMIDQHDYGTWQHVLFANSTTESSSSEASTEVSRIEIPYSIVGTFILLFSFVVFGFYIKGVPKGYPIRHSYSKFRDMISPGSCTNGHNLYGIGLLVCLFFYFIQAVGGERAYGKFLFSFAIESEVNLSKDSASYLQSAFWLCFTLGRLCGIPLAKFVPLNIIIAVDIVGNIITAIVLSIYAYDTETILWVFTCFLGFFVAVVFPNGMSWANLRMHMNSVAVMVLMVGGSFGGFIYQYTTGYLFEYSGPNSLMFIMLGYGVALMLSFTAMSIVAVLCKPSNNMDNTDDEVEIIEADYPTKQYALASKD